MLSKIIDFIPALAFFICYKLTNDLIFATAVIVGSCAAALVINYALTKSVSRMQIFVTAAVVLFGLPTVLLNDPSIIKWKVTVVNLILAIAIAVCQLGLKRNPFSYLFGRELRLPDEVWLKMGLWWMIYFVFAAGINVIIAFCLPALFGIDEAYAESLWVDYKTFGNAILNCAFAIICVSVLLRSHPELAGTLKAGNHTDDTNHKG